MAGGLARPEWNEWSARPGLPHRSDASRFSDGAGLGTSFSRTERLAGLPADSDGALPPVAVGAGILGSSRAQTKMLGHRLEVAVGMQQDVAIQDTERGDDHVDGLTRRDALPT
jgi:hypothetical protein